LIAFLEDSVVLAGLGMESSAAASAERKDMSVDIAVPA